MGGAYQLLGQNLLLQQEEWSVAVGETCKYVEEVSVCTVCYYTRAHDKCNLDFMLSLLLRMRNYFRTLRCKGQ